MTTTQTEPLSHTVRRVIGLASLAPSVHNTQPWWWRVQANLLELHADPDRQLTAADPHGRNMTISCGAALHQAVVAAGALGWPATVDRLPEGDPPGPLAALRLHRGPPPETAERDLELLEERRTDRRRFTSWPVPLERLRTLASLSLPFGVRTVVVEDVSDRFRVDLLLSRASAIQARDPEVRAELGRWLDGAEDGVPRQALPPTAPTDAPSRFPPGTLDDVGRELTGTDSLLALTTPHERARDWLHTGEALSAIWLAAAAAGLSVVPVSQPLEVTETREALQHEILDTHALPQMLLRIGWQPIARPTLPRTPRRPLDDIIRP